MKIFALILACSIGCSAAHRGVYRDDIPKAIAGINYAVTNPAIQAAAAPFPPVSIALAIAALLTGGASGHFVGRRRAAKQTNTAEPSAPKLAA